MRTDQATSVAISPPGSTAERARRVRTLSLIRWAGAVFGAVQVLTFYRPYPGNTFLFAMAAVGALFVGNLIIWVIVRVAAEGTVARLMLPSLVLDTAALTAIVFIYGFDPDTSIWALLYILPLEGALLYQRRGALGVMSAAAILYIVREVYSTYVYGYEFLFFSVTYRLGIGFLIAAVAGATTERLVWERNSAARSQDEVSDLNQQLTTLLSNLPGMAYRCRNDAAWTMEFVSDGIEELTGYPSDAFISQRVTYADLIHPDDRERVWEQVQAGVEANRPFQVEYRLMRRGGSECWVWEQGQRMSDGRLEGLVIDTSERKRLEGALVQVQKMDAVGRIAGGVAHDFNNLLSVIQNYAAFVKEGLEESRRNGRGDLSEIEADVVEIQEAARRGASLISQLLAFSRQDVSQPTQLRLVDAVGEIRRLLRRAVRETIELDFELEDAGWVLIGQSQLEQVLLNLVVNAGDAMPDGGKVVLRTRSEVVDESLASQHIGMVPGAYATLSVSDSGLGIEPDKLNRIFEPFFTTKQRGAGTGLGLASVYGIVKKADGYVRVDSEVGRGTTFTIYLPSVPEPAPAPELEEKPSPPVVGTGRVLVVEDEPGVRATIDRILRRAGFEVELAPDPRTAISTASSGDFDLLITDLVMPGMSGWLLVDRLTEAGLRPPNVLYMSGYDDALTTGRGKNVSLLQKPFSRDELLAAIRDATKKTR